MSCGDVMDGYTFSQEDIIPQELTSGFAKYLDGREADIIGREAGIITHLGYVTDVLGKQDPHILAIVDAGTDAYRALDGAESSTVFVVDKPTGVDVSHALGAAAHACHHLGVSEENGKNVLLIGSANPDNQIIASVAAQIKTGSFAALSAQGLYGDALERTVTRVGIDKLSPKELFHLAAQVVVRRDADKMSDFLGKEPITAAVHFKDDEGNDVFQVIRSRETLTHAESFFLLKSEANKNGDIIVLPRIPTHNKGCLCFGCCDSRGLPENVLGSDNNIHTVANIIHACDPQNPNDPIYARISAYLNAGGRDLYFLGHTARARRKIT